MMRPASIESARRMNPQTTAALHELLARIERDYRETPGLSVTARQAERLWEMGSTTCSFVLMTLMLRGVLRQAVDGTYVRA